MKNNRLDTRGNSAEGSWRGIKAEQSEKKEKRKTMLLDFRAQGGSFKTRVQRNQ